MSTAQEPEAACLKGPKLDLKAVLSAHTRWLETGGVEGERLDLRNLDLAELDLSGNRLCSAIFWGSELRWARFTGADLTGADLTNCDLREADFCYTIVRDASLLGAQLQDAKFHHADLSNADLSPAEDEDRHDLVPAQFSGARLSGAKLHASFDIYGGLAKIDELSRHSRTIFFALIVACIYTWLTIAATADVSLLQNAAGAPLPIINTPVSIARFFTISMIVLLVVYIYLHLYLQRLWERIAVLPAVFPDGRAIDEHTFPWVLMGLVRARLPLLRSPWPTYYGLQMFLTIFAAWFLVPGTMLFVWARYLAVHDLPGSVAQLAIFTLCMVLGISFFSSAWRTLPGRRSPGSPLLDVTWVGPFAALAFAGGIVVYSICDGAINGMPASIQEEKLKYGEPLPGGLRRLVPSVLESAGFRPFLDIRETELATKPKGWHLPQSYEQVRAQATAVSKVKLTGLNLQYAHADGAFLVRADLSRSSLVGVRLSNAVLHLAVFTGADLREAEFANAELWGAELGAAKMDYVDFRGANLSHAVLDAAHLKQNKLDGAVMDDASLVGAFLTDLTVSGASFKRAILNVTDLSRSVFIDVCFDRATMVGAILNGARITDSSLKDTNLTRADLANAVFENVDFSGADLTNSNLSGADLSSSNIVQEQLDSACGTQSATLPENLEPGNCQTEGFEQRY